MRQRDQYAEPFRIKMVESIRLIGREEREEKIAEAGFNVFNLSSSDVYIDLLTDSGTSAMSDRQWSALLEGDESYAGSRSYDRLRDAVGEILGYPHLVPTHQGRAAENILMNMLVKEGDRVLGNMHFDTTEGHIQLRGAEAVNLVVEDGYRIASGEPFKGNIDLERLEDELRRGADRVPFVLLTVTCNNNGGQPVSMENIREASRLAHRYGVPLFFDAARFAENAYFISQREPGYAGRDIRDIAREMFSWGDGCTMSGKKDGLVNIGGFLAFADEDLFHQAVQWQIPFEGFITYGGMAGRDLEALARGIFESTEKIYLEDRIGQVRHLADRLDRAGVPIVLPPGGHGVFIDALAFFPHIRQAEFPAQSLVVELYVEGGVRAVELGTCAFARTDPETGEVTYPRLELVRLAVPRRVYTDRHMDRVADAVVEVYRRRDQVRGLRLTHEVPLLRHFTARFARLD
ncbi:MAG: tryptophanase [Bacillota bacterium]